MEAVITVTQFDGKTFWLAQRFCLSNEEAKSAKVLLDAMPSPAAYMEPHHANIAIAEGFPATGGGASSQAMPSAEPAPELSPATEALIERGDEDAPLSGLKAGEAYRDEEE